MHQQQSEKCCPSEHTRRAPHTHSSVTRQAVWVWRVGRILLFCGIGLLLLAVVERTSGLPFRLPDFWYPVRSLWPFVGIVIACVGVAMIRHEQRLEWTPHAKGNRFQKLVLYTRQDCPLCDDAKAVLERYAEWLPAVTEVDIDTDAVLIAKYTMCVPVVELDEKVRFRGRIDELLLRRLIEGTSPTS